MIDLRLLGCRGAANDQQICMGFGAQKQTFRRWSLPAEAIVKYTSKLR